MRYLTAPLTVIIVFALQSKQLNAQTSVCNETWSGTIVLDSDVLIEEGCNLFVEPGTVVQGESFTLTVEGAITAIGSVEQPISFNIGSLISRTDASSFLIEHALIEENLQTGEYSGEYSYLPELTALMSEADVYNEWDHFLIENGIPESTFGPNSGIGEVSQNFDETNSYSPWSSGWYYWGTDYFDNSPISLATEGDNTFVQQSGAIYTTASSVANDLSASFSVNSQSIGEYVTEIEFDYRLKGHPNTTFSILVKEGGSSAASYQTIGGTTVQNEWVHFNLEIPGNWQSIDIKLRATGLYYPGQGSVAFYNGGDLDNFVIRTNFSSTTEGVPFLDAVLRHVNSGGITLSHVDWHGAISVACEACEIILSNSTFIPNENNSSALSIQGEQVNLLMTDCSVHSNYYTGVHLEDCSTSSANLMRCQIQDAASHGIYSGNGWVSSFNNVRLSSNTGPGIIARSNESLALDYCTIAENQGLAIEFSGSGILDITNSIIWGNNLGSFSQIEATDGLVQTSYSNIQGLSDFGFTGDGTFSIQEGNLELAPQFASLLTLDLEPYSPCVDAGEPYFDDAYRPPGKGEPRSDMGWLGGPHLLPTSTFGCTESEACNYFPDAVSDDNSCYFPEEFYDCSGTCINDFDSDGICDELETNPDQYSDGYSDGYAAGLLAGQENCESTPSSTSCGPGTIWDEFYNLCLPTEVCTGDLNDDGVRGTYDLLLLLANYGEPCDGEQN